MFNWIAKSSFFLSIVSIAGAMGLLYAGMQVPGEALAVNSVSVGDNFFQAASITVQTGSAVEWTNNGNLPHTVTASNGSFDSGLLKNAQTFSQVFEAAGAFSYNCSFHPEMVGTVVVEQGIQPTPEPTVAPAAPNPNPAPAAPVAPAPQVVGGPGELPVGGGPPIDPGMARGALLLVVLGIAFAAVGAGTVFLTVKPSRAAR